jgi:hypothetical protein
MADLDDDPPRRRCRRDMEDDEDRDDEGRDDGPRRRARADDDYRNDDRPGRRRRDADDDEDTDDRPRRRRDLDDNDAGARRPGRTRRVYVHETCGGETVIFGDDFTRLANPFGWVGQTYCATCEKYAGLGKFFWADTDEDLVSYRRRLRRKAPLSLKLWSWFFGPALGALVGALIGVVVSPTDALKGVIVGGLSGALVFTAFLVQYIAKWFWAIDYRGKK